MRLAALSDIHANKKALLAVLEDLRTQEKNGVRSWIMSYPIFLMILLTTRTVRVGG
jgi:hypothetical protein